MDLAKFAALLATRLRSRYDVGNGVFYLDLRAKAFGNRGPMMLRDHTAAGWPAAGSAVVAPPKDDEKAYAVAERAAREYVMRHYGPHLHALVYGGGVRRTGTPTVEEACSQYLKNAEKRLGPSHNTVKNRRSDLKNHVVRHLGSKALALVTAEEVEQVLLHLTVKKSSGRARRKREVPAAFRTKRNVLRALRAVWRDAFPRKPCPFTELEFDDGSERRSLRQAIESGTEEEVLRDHTGALDPERVGAVLAAAAYYDRTLASEPRWRSIAVPNTTATIAAQIATGARIGELALLRWWMIKEELGVMLLPGTKNQKSLRLVPIQDCLRPWLAELKRLACPDGGEPNRNAYVFFTSRTKPGKRPSKRTLEKHVAWALELAGLKVPRVSMVGKATHWARATHISWASMETERIEPEWLSAYAAHATGKPFVHMTAHYISVRAAEMPERHRQYIRHLPTPDVVQARAPFFEPAVVRPWRERCTVRRPKTPEAARRQEERLEQLRAQHSRRQSEPK